MNSAIERLLKLRVADVMRQNLVTLAPSETMATAAAKFLEHGISGAPVVNSHGQCVGVLSATDFVRQGRDRTSAAQHSDQEWVEGQMSRAVVTIHADRSLIDAAREMCTEHVHRLPVVDRSGKLVGLVSSLDLMAAMVAAVEE